MRACSFRSDIKRWLWLQSQLNGWMSDMKRARKKAGALCELCHCHKPVTVVLWKRDIEKDIVNRTVATLSIERRSLYAEWGGKEQRRLLSSWRPVFTNEAISLLHTV